MTVQTILTYMCTDRGEWCCLMFFCCQHEHREDQRRRDEHFDEDALGSICSLLQDRTGRNSEIFDSSSIR
jgi:hypothetical protein